MMLISKSWDITTWTIEDISSNRLCHQTEHTYIIVHWVALISHVREARREIFTTPGLVTARRSILGPPAEGRPGPSLRKTSHCQVLLESQPDSNGSKYEMADIKEGWVDRGETLQLSSRQGK